MGISDIGSLATLAVVEPDAIRRRRLTIVATVLGVVLSVASFHISVLTQFQYFEEAVRIEGWGAFFYSIFAAVAALIVMPLAVYHIRDMAQRPGHPFVWLALGLIFGIGTPLFTGGFGRVALAFSGLVEGHYGVVSFFSLMLDAVLVFPYDFVVQGTPNVILGIEIGFVFAGIGFIADRLNATTNEVSSTWGPWVVTVAGGVAMLLFALFGPIDFLRDL